MSYLYFLWTIPTHFIGVVFITFNLLGFREKLRKCISAVDSNARGIPDLYVDYLVSAEDHRSRYHQGIDHIGMLRALYKKISGNNIQGASTIEQQFVRVVTEDYSQTITRKLREQFLSVLLSKKRSKQDIAKAYLAVAYYGYNYQGLEGITKLVGSNLELASEMQIISLVARLKYPEPKNDSAKWEEKIRNRVIYIQKRHENATNKSRQRMLRTAV
ncbi:transglycosylase domain-containing protein [Ectopseudomonas hydrolytica]|uniref:transglycosylase domain-containing protein n=1 Tax=Ectopseudomonas hydrolytica TaxID=2493633 RepID=UPI003C2CFC9E